LGARVDVSGHDPSVGISIGSLSGGGDIYLGGTALTLGNLDQSDLIEGEIRDGGLFGGSGGSINKIGTGTLSLVRANTYTGGTTINAGRLRTLDAGALGTGPVTLNGGVLDPVGDITVSDNFNFAGGAVATRISTSAEVVRVANQFVDAGGKDFLITTTPSATLNTPYTLVTFDTTTYADAAGFQAISITPNVTLKYIFDFDVAN